MKEYFLKKKSFIHKLAYGKRHMKDTNAIISFSGGLDSTGIISVLKYLGVDKIQPVFFNRGQSNYNEEKNAGEKVLQIASELYKDSILDLIEIKTSIPTNYVKETFKKKSRRASTQSVYTLRNLKMLDELYNIGRCLNDECYRKENDVIFDRLSNGNVTSDKTFGDGNIKGYKLKNLEYKLQTENNIIKCYMPFLWLDLDKNESFAFALDCNLEFADALFESYSCWNPNGPCNTCKPCEEREEAINFASRIGIEV